MRYAAHAELAAADLADIWVTRDIFDAHAARSAVAEPAPAEENPPIALTEAESMLYRHLRTLDRGRLEQEFLPTDLVGDAVTAWGGGSSR